MQFIVRIGQSRLAPCAISCNESEGRSPEDILNILHRRARSEFNDLARNCNLQLSAIIPTVDAAVREALKSRRGLHETYEIDGERLQPRSRRETERSGNLFLDLLILDDAHVAERDAFVDRIFGNEAVGSDT